MMCVSKECPVYGKRALKRQRTKCWGSEGSTQGQGQLERVRAGKALGEMLHWAFERQIRINLMKGEQAFKACKPLCKDQSRGKNSMFRKLPVIQADGS